MWRIPATLALITALWLGAGCAATCMDGAALADHSGYTDCIRLENNNTRVVLGPHCGGRVLEYSWNGVNVLATDPKQNGKTGMHNPYAGRFDIGPEMIVPDHPILWNGAWQAEIIGPRAARLTSQEDPATGLQLIREFRLDKTGAHLSCTQIMKNISTETKEYCYWSRTLALGGGIVLIPLTPNTHLPRNYVMYKPGRLVNFLPDDPNIRTRGGFLEITGTPEYPKLGMDSMAGWFAYLMKSNLLFVKRYPTFPDRVYNDAAGLTISIYYLRKQMCELEPIGPRETIRPGASAAFTEDWWLLPYPFPENREHVNLKHLARTVAAKAR